MQKDTETLLKIQEKDVKILSLKKQSNLLPEGLKVVRDNVSETEEKIKAKQEEIKKMQVARKELEVDIETKQGNIKKFEVQLYQVKTNEEYKAMQKQIADVKFECGLIEDKILEKMEEIEKTQAGLKELENILANSKKILEEKEKETKNKVEAIFLEIENIKKERDDLVKSIPPDFLSKYELIFNNKRGAALVAIENKTCLGCHMTLPPNVINEVKRGSNIIICDNCARILYYPDSA